MQWKDYLTNKEIILLGDININYLYENERKHRLIKTFLELGFKTKVYESWMSDHLPMCVVWKYQKRQKQSQHHTITYRDCKNFDEQAFLRDLNTAPWSSMEMFDDPDDALDFFNKMFLDIVDAHVPLVQERVRKVT